MPKKLVFELQLLNPDLSVKCRQRFRPTLDPVEIEWPSLRQKLQDFCEKKGWGNCKVQYLNGTELVELRDPSSLRRYLELHQETLQSRDTSTLPLYLVPDPTDGLSSPTIDGEEIVLEVDQEGSPIALTLDSDMVLGAGGFGKVLRAQDRETLIYYAVKMSFEDERSQKQMKTEISTLVQLTHPHIVSVFQHGYVLDPVNDRLPAYMMDLGLCSVDALLVTGWHNKAAAHAAQRDVSSALQHLNSEKLGHMDVKPGNWLVTNKLIKDGQTELELKLIDAGGAGMLDEDPVTSFTAAYAHSMHQGEGFTQMIVRYGQAFFDWYGLRISIFQLSSSDSDHDEVPTDQQVLQKAAENVASDKKFILQAVQENGFALQFASDTLRADEEVVMAAVRQHGFALQFASESLQDTQRVGLEAVQEQGDALQFGSAKLRSDKKVVMQAVQNNGNALRFACKTLQSDKDVVMSAIRQDRTEKNLDGDVCSSLKFACRTLQSDKSFVLEVVSEDGCALEFACETLQADKEVVMTAVRKDGFALKFACETLQADKKVVMTAILKQGYALKFACKRFRSDKNLVLEAVRQHGRALRFASDTLRTDRQVVLAAVSQDGSALQFAGEKLQSEKEIASVAVQNSGRALEFVSGTLQSQKDLVLEAVRKDGSALQYACKTLRAEKDVVMVAVRNDDFALFYACGTLQSDKEVVMEAVQHSRFALNFACATLQRDKDVLALAKA